MYLENLEKVIKLANTEFLPALNKLYSFKLWDDKTEENFSDMPNSFDVYNPDSIKKATDVRTKKISNKELWEIELKNIGQSGKTIPIVILTISFCSEDFKKTNKIELVFNSETCKLMSQKVVHEFS